MNDQKYERALTLLTDMYKKTGRLPKRQDFTGDEVCLIKQKLGPWPRALEAAGLKEAPLVNSKDKSRMKREKAKQKRKEFKDNEGDLNEKV